MSPTQDFRQAALAEFEKLLPISTKADEFKYTNLEAFSFRKYASDFAARLVALKDGGEKYPGTKVIRLS
ncbi:MAG TPA: hypothetical protein VM901_06015, partial [Bdellovibrionota bacterium]|nr:hypothetical protein [Bdellovibrionota bacterium]